MATRIDQGTGMYVSDQVGGYFATAADARAAEQGQGPAQVNTRTSPWGASGFTGSADAASLGANQADFFGEGTADSATAPDAPAPVTRDPFAARNAQLHSQADTTANQNATVDYSGANDSGSYGTADSAAAYNAGNIGGASGAYNATSAAGRSGYDYSHDLNNPNTFISGRTLLNRTGERAGVSHFGDSANPNPLAGGFRNPLTDNPLADIADPNHGLGLSNVNSGRSITAIAPQAAEYGSQGLTNSSVPSQATGGGGGGGSGATTSGSAPPGGDRERAAAERTSQAETAFDAEHAANQTDTKDAENDWAGAINDIKGGDYGMSDEARAFQKEGLQQQRDLLKRTLGFDPNQYATQFADQGLARQVALARSGGSAAQQQAQTFAAMDQAPALYAEGARTAAGLENQRLSTAEGAATAFGNLGTMTRNSDEARAQFESNLTTEIAKQVGTLSEGRMTLNEEDSKVFAQMWTDFAQLQSVYAGMDSSEQLAWWQKEATERGQDKQFQGIMESLKKNGAISPKDLIGGLFQLGGGVVGAGGMIGAAYAGKKAAEK